jgi:hypothetical protein
MFCRASETGSNALGMEFLPLTVFEICTLYIQLYFRPKAAKSKNNTTQQEERRQNNRPIRKQTILTILK